MTRSLILAVLAAALAPPAAAHDFWLEPAAFRLSSPGYVSVRARVGHQDDQAGWPAGPARVVTLISIGPDGVTDQQKALTSDPALGLLTPEFATEGLHLLSLVSNHSVSELGAEAFNAYVEEEGVTPIDSARRGKDARAKPGREIYSRRGKTLMLVGDLAPADDRHITRPIGLTLEIVPHQNPLRADPMAGFAFEVRYRGAPLPGATVHIARLDDPDVSRDPIVTDAEGQAVFAAPEGGAWMLHTVWSSPATHDARGDFDTTFSSFTFRFLPRS